MTDGVLSRIFSSQWAVLLLSVFLLLSIAELGYRLGLRLHAPGNEGRKKQISQVQAAVLGLLGLLLGFTFAIAGNRFDQRRSLVVQEANAVGTTYLRADLLPGSHREPVKGLLRRYVDVRLEYQRLADDPAKLAEGMRLSSDIQGELWTHAAAAAREAPNQVTVAFIESLNETIDTDAERIAAGRARIPSGMWILLLIVAAFGCVTTGYGAGADAARTALSSVALPLIITLVIILIFDLAHPHQGLIGISQQPLFDLQQSIRPGPRGLP